MKKRKSIAVALIIASIMIQGGCASTNSKQTITENVQTEKQQKPEQTNFIGEFNSLTEKEAATEEVISFLDKNISQVSKEDASKMAMKLEEIQKKNISKVEEKIFKQDIQTKFIKLQETGINFNKFEDVKDAALKDLIKEVNETGYKIETAEGMYFPIINYEFYKKYSEYVTPDIKEYIEIMAIESNKVPAKDAALVIGWDEIIKRAVRQERFINNFNDSAKINDVKNLYKLYVTYAFYGSNNTPLFSYDSKVINQKAKEAYTNLVKVNDNSRIIKKLDEFLKVLENNKYKLTDSVEKLRKDATDYLSDSTLI